MTNPQPQPANLCLKSYGAYGPCIRPKDHDGLCEDAHGWGVTGRRETSIAEHENPHYFCDSLDTRPCPTGEHQNPSPARWTRRAPSIGDKVFITTHNIEAATATDIRVLIPAGHKGEVMAYCGEMYWVSLDIWEASWVLLSKEDFARRPKNA